jgi:Flp pilus assembly protein TadG
LNTRAAANTPGRSSSVAKRAFDASAGVLTRWLRRPRVARGQSVVEFALVVPIMVVLLVAIIDFARVYTTMMTVESAAREAADFGTTLGAQRWDSGLRAGTIQEMQRRACIATSNLPDYADADTDPSTGCANPTFACSILTTGTPCDPYDAADTCEQATREPPCQIKVTITYDFHLFAPIHFDILGASIGLPSTITVQRDSVYAMTDIDVAATPPTGP